MAYIDGGMVYNCAIVLEQEVFNMGFEDDLAQVDGNIDLVFNLVHHLDEDIEHFHVQVTAEPYIDYVNFDYVFPILEKEEKIHKVPDEDVVNYTSYGSTYLENHKPV